MPFDFPENLQQELLERGMKGDRAAQEQLLWCYYDQLARFIRRRLPTDSGSSGPEDVLHQTFVQVLQRFRICDFRPNSEHSFYSYLRRTAERIIRSKYRRQARNVGSEKAAESSFGDPLERVFGELSTPSSTVRRQECVEQVKAALSSLPQEQRTALQMRYIDDFTIAQVARLMGKSEAAVRGLLRRGREELRRKLADPPS